MKYQDLEQLAKDGRLTVSKTLYRTRERFAKYPSKDTVKYRVFMYSARTDDMADHESFKITRQDLKDLLKVGAKVGEMFPN